MLYVVFLGGIFVLGLFLLAAGVILLLKVANKLPGLLAVAAGVLLTVSPVLIFLALTIVRSSSG